MKRIPRQEVIYLFPLLTVSRLKLKNIFQRQSRSTDGGTDAVTKGNERERDRGREWKKKRKVRRSPPWQRNDYARVEIQKRQVWQPDIVWSRWNYFPPGTVSREIKRFSSARVVMKRRWFTNDFRFLETRRSFELNIKNLEAFAVLLFVFFIPLLFVRKQTQNCGG